MTLCIVLTTSKANALVAATGYAGTTLDTLDITAGFARDAAGNAASTDAVANAPLFTHAGQSIVDLGSYGQLIAPVQVEGKWYYHWDRNDNGSSAGDYYNSDASSGFFPLSEIYNLFKQDLNGTAGSSTDNTYRYATVNGIRLALPTLGANFGDLYSRSWDGNYELLGTTLADPGQTNNYDDLSAIWDAYNGTLVGSYIGQGLNGINRGSGTTTSGAPLTWDNDTYVSATPWAGRSDYAALRFYDGLVLPHSIWAMNIAVEVVDNTNAATPLILDLNNDGVRTLGTDAGVQFDLTGLGRLASVGWSSPEDGFLVRDMNDDGLINDGAEMFGEATVLANGERAQDGFEALSDLDTNQDAVVDNQDEAFNSLAIWRDANTDGVTDAGELLTLAQHGIESLNLSYTESDRVDNGNQLRLVSSFTKTDGSQHEMVDVWLATFHENLSEAEMESALRAYVGAPEPTDRDASASIISSSNEGTEADQSTIAMISAYNTTYEEDLINLESHKI